MTKIVLKNSQLTPAKLLLLSLTLKPKQSRCRSKLIRLIDPAIEGLQESQQELFRRYCKTDSDGELLHDSDGSVKPIEGTIAEFGEEMTALANEEVTITGGIYSQNIDQIPEILAEITDDLRGESAEVYDALMDQFEEAENDKITDDADGDAKSAKD